MICVSQVDLHIIPDIALCEYCHVVLDTLYNFKIKCLDVEKNMKEYQKLYSIVDFTGLSTWYNAFIKNEKYNVEDFTIKQEVDLAEEKEIVENVYDPNNYEQSFKCFRWEYSTAHKINLQRHMQTRTSKFECSQCGYCARCKSQLKIHIYTHNSEKPFKCLQCDYRVMYKN